MTPPFTILTTHCAVQKIPYSPTNTPLPLPPAQVICNSEWERGLKGQNVASMRLHWNFNRVCVCQGGGGGSNPKNLRGGVWIFSETIHWIQVMMHYVQRTLTWITKRKWRQIKFLFQNLIQNFKSLTWGTEIVFLFKALNPFVILRSFGHLVPLLLQCVHSDQGQPIKCFVNCPVALICWNKNNWFNKWMPLISHQTLPFSYKNADRYTVKFRW